MRNRIFTALVAASLVSLAACGGGDEAAEEGMAADTAAMSTGMDTMTTMPTTPPMDTMAMGTDTAAMAGDTAATTDTAAADTTP